MKRGRPAEAENSADQCQASTIMTEWKKAHKIGPRCPFVAKVRIDGRQFCNRHAVIEALAVLVESGKARMMKIVQIVVFVVCFLCAFFAVLLGAGLSGIWR